MNSFKQYLQSQGKSKSTVTHYNSYALDFLSWLDKDNTEPEQATAKEVMAYMNILQNRGYEAVTRNIRLNVIKHFFNYQIELGHKTENPIQHLKIRGSKKQKLYPILDPQQLQKIYDDYPIPGEDDKRKNRNWFRAFRLSKLRNKAILSLMVNQGLTTPEVEKLVVNDLKLKEGLIYIAGGRKSNERTLELKSNQIIELMEYTWQVRPLFLEYQENETKITTNLFLPNPSLGQKLSKQNQPNTLCVWKSLTKELKETSSSFINFKQVRTSVITHWLKQFNLRQVQYMAGHRYVSSTERYLVNQVDDLQKDVDEFHPF
jgi:integrase/recombinase XerD